MMMAAELRSPGAGGDVDPDPAPSGGLQIAVRQMLVILRVVMHWYRTGSN